MEIKLEYTIEVDGVMEKYEYKIEDGCDKQMCILLKAATNILHNKIHTFIDTLIE